MSITDISTIVSLIANLATGLVGGVIGSVAWYRFFRKREQRLFKNINRPIAIIATEKNPMQHECDLLRRVGFFHVGTPSTDERAPDMLNGNRLVIIGYSPKSRGFEDAFIAAKQRDIPVIVYAKPGEIEPDDMCLIQGYSHQSMSNTPLRLISDVFAIMSTYPEDK